MEPSGKGEEIAGLSIGIGAALGWAIYAIGTKLGRTQGFSASDLAILRYLVPLVLIPILVFGAARIREQLTLMRAIALTLCVGPLFALANNTAFGMAPLSHGVVIGPGTTLITANLLLLFIDGRRIPFVRVAGFGLVILGIVIISSEHASEPAVFWRVLTADALLVLAGAMWGTFTYLVGRWQITAIPAIASVSFLGTLVFLPVYLAFLGPTPGLETAQWGWQVIFQGVIGGLLAPVFFALAVTRLGSGRAAVFPAMVPSVAVLLAVPITGTIPGPITVTGVLIATLGMAASLDVVRLPVRRSRR